MNNLWLNFLKEFLEEIDAELLRITPDRIIRANSSRNFEGIYGEIPEEIFERIPAAIPAGILEIKHSNNHWRNLLRYPRKIPAVMSGEIPRGILEGTYGRIHIEILEGSYGKIPCIIAEVSLKISDGIVRGISESFFFFEQALKESQAEFHMEEYTKKKFLEKSLD